MSKRNRTYYGVALVPVGAVTEYGMVTHTARMDDGTFNVTVVENPEAAPKDLVADTINVPASALFAVTRVEPMSFVQDVSMSVWQY